MNSIYLYVVEEEQIIVTVSTAVLIGPGCRHVVPQIVELQLHTYTHTHTRPTRLLQHRLKSTRDYVCSKAGSRN